MTAPSEDLLSAYLDDELDAADRALVERRLAESAEWRTVLDALGETRSLLRGLPLRDAPPGFIDELLAAAVPATEEPADIAAPVAIDAKRRRRTRIAGWVAGGAAAAAIAAVVLVPTQSQVKPAVATFVNSHAARASVSEEPVSELAPVATPVRLGR
jgi:anti-sigma factor RsiW